MKKHVLLLALAVVFGTAAFAQIDITAGAGYNFGAKVPIYYGEIKMKGNTTYGAGIEYLVDDETGIQFSYSFAQTNVIIRDYGPYGSGSYQPFSDVNTNYFLLNGVRYFGSDVIRPYANFGLGMAYYNFSNWDKEYEELNSKNDYYRFAVGFGLGTKVMISDNIGINVQARALAPIQFGGVGIGVGTGGVSSGVYAGSSFLSGDVSGGLVIHLGE